MGDKITYKMAERIAYKHLLKQIEKRKKAISQNKSILVSNMTPTQNNKILKWQSEIL